MCFPFCAWLSRRFKNNILSIYLCICFISLSLSLYLSNFPSIYLSIPFLFLKHASILDLLSVIINLSFTFIVSQQIRRRRPVGVLRNILFCFCIKIKLDKRQFLFSNSYTCLFVDIRKSFANSRNQLSSVVIWIFNSLLMIGGLAPQIINFIDSTHSW